MVGWAASMSDDLGPRLPDRADPKQSQLDLDWTGATYRPADEVAEMEWEEFDEPELRSLTGVRRIVVSTRMLVVGWAVTVFVAALAARSDAKGGFDDGEVIALVSRIGVVVAVVFIVAGWVWSDLATRNVHTLRASLPPR